MEKNVDSKTDHEAVWRWEALTAWWCNLTEKERQQMELLSTHEMFVLGWQCGRAKANGLNFLKNETDN